MKYPGNYNCLVKNKFIKDEYEIVPLRYDDRNDIRKWRNEQIYHLRQDKLLTEKAQNNYFENIVSKLFTQEKPNQILFSFLKDQVCVGYGGLVHINWIDKNAEISFVMNTELEKVSFKKYWDVFLNLIEQVAFNVLNFHKIFTYAFDVRPHLYNIFIKAGFFEEVRLKEHCYIDNKFIDVIIHSKINKL
jgi:RimJ/RimL family protein N-acetyltransferase